MADSLSSILTTVQNGVSALNNLAQILNQATINSSSLQVTISSTIFITAASTNFGTGTVTTVNTSIGLTGGPITTVGTLAVSLTKLTNSLSSDVTLSNTSSYFDGPIVAQGSSGTWFASGNVTLTDTAIANVSLKLWDGTTVIDSGNQFIPVATSVVMAGLSGFITNPVGNIRISCRDITTVNGKILANQSGNSKDSTITVVRIG